MKKILFALLISILIFSCKKGDESVVILQEMLLDGEASALWTVTYSTSEHREGYILNGIKTYTDTTAATEIDSSGNEQYLFYDSGNIDIFENDTLVDFITNFTYEIINDDRIELEGDVNLFGYLLPIWMQWDITSKTSSRIEFIYDDFFPGDNPGENDTVFFDCDQGMTIMERL